MEASKEFREAVEEARSDALDSVIGSIWDMATGAGGKAKNIIAAIYYTKNKDPQNWNDRRGDALPELEKPQPGAIRFITITTVGGQDPAQDPGDVPAIPELSAQPAAAAAGKK